MPRQYTPRVLIVCAICETPLLIPPYRVGRTRYCGWTCRKASITRHGDSRTGQRSPEYSAWEGMKARCLNPANASYSAYGGRGITVCEAWRESFESFIADVGRRPSPQHSLDRINNATGHYEPGNVRWATSREQAQNRRSNRLITHAGITQSVSAWSCSTGIGYDALISRLDRGWTIERALAFSDVHSSD